MIKKKLGAKLRDLFSRDKYDENFFEDLEDALIEGDIGAALTMDLVDSLKQESSARNIGDRDGLLALLKELLMDVVIAEPIPLVEDKLNTLLVLGVNGVGKTTTIAKLANYYGNIFGKEKVLLSAGDTFRAAAIDQLALHAERLNVSIIAQQPGADPGAVIYDTIESGIARDARVILADTAGRMHNKANLIKELQKIHKIVEKKLSPAQYKKMLIIDATTGQNGLQQAEIFHEAVGVDSAILAKYDSTAKGGIALSICRKLSIPFSFLGTGERYEDLHPFDKEEYLNVLLGI